MMNKMIMILSHAEVRSSFEFSEQCSTSVSLVLHSDRGITQRRVEFCLDMMNKMDMMDMMATGRRDATPSF